MEERIEDMGKNIVMFQNEISTLKSDNARLVNKEKAMYKESVRTKEKAKKLQEESSKLRINKVQGNTVQ